MVIDGELLLTAAVTMGGIFISWGVAKKTVSDTEEKVKQHDEILPEIGKLQMLSEISNQYFDLVHEQYTKRDEVSNANADFLKFEQQNQKDLEKLYNSSKTFYKPDKETNKKETQKKEVKLKKSISA